MFRNVLCCCDVVILVEFYLVSYMCDVIIEDFVFRLKKRRSNEYKIFRLDVYVIIIDSLIWWEIKSYLLKLI